MKQISLVKDKIDGSPFAVLLINKNNVTAYGAPGQGNTWAQWINSQNTTLSEVDELLDVRLAINAPVLANSINESYVSTFLDQPTTDMLMNELNKKSFLQVVEAKSEPEPEFIEEIESDLPDFIPVTEWPLSDVSLSAIDVAYKSLLTEYKAKAFQADMQRRSLELEVKWARALWDNDRQGWRCPPNTVNGGQFTNRMGLGCSTGMVRRLGQTLMSIEDRNKLQMTLPGMEDPRGFLYRAGELIDQRAETRVRKFAEGKERRAARKVRSLIAKEGEKAKEQAEKEQRNLKKTSKRFARSGEKLRDIYGIYTPDASVPARLRAAATVKLRSVAQDAEQRAITNLNRSQRRRYRAMSNVTEGKLSPRKITKLRDFGGRIPGSKVGGYVVASPADKEQVDDVFDHDGKPHVWKVFTDMDEMHANPWFGKEFLKDNSQVDIPNPHQNHKWVTVEEILAMASVNNATKPSHDWIEMRRGRGFKQQNGQNGDMLIRYADTGELKTLAKKNGYYAPRSNLKDNGMASAVERGQGRKKTKPSQSGPIGDMLFEPDELPPSVRKRVNAAWTRSRQNLGEWVRSLDPLLEDDKKTRRQNRRSQRTKTKTTSSATAANILTAMLGAEPNKTGAKKLYTEENAIYFPQDPMNEQGFNFDFLDRVWTNEPTAPAARYGWNEVVGEPTREFESLKNLVDRIIAEHDAGVMTQSADSANDLEGLVQLLRGNSYRDEGVRTSGLASLHNARVVELFDGEENKKVIMLDTMNFLPWLGEEEDGSEDGTSGLIALTSYSTQIDAPDDVVELAEQGKLRLQELVEMAREANVAQNSGTISQGQAFGYTLPNRGGWSVVRWNSTRGIAFNKAGAPLSIAAQEYYGGSQWDEGTFSTYIPGSKNSRVDLRSGGLISGQMGKETIVTPEGQNVWENSSIDPWTGLPLDPQKQAIFSGGKRVAPGGRSRRRSSTGTTPQSPGIVDRFLSGEGRQLSRERREARRAIKGKLPRDTRPIRQRIQAAAIERGRRVTGEARPEWIQAPELDRSVLERESIAATGELPSTQRLNRTELPHIYDFPTPEDFPTGAMWGNSGDNRQRLDNLNDSLVDMGNSFYPPVTQEDIDKAAELAEILYQWLDDVNDPSQPELPGEKSNWGHTSWVTMGDFSYVTDDRDETMPPVAIIHKPSGTTHFMDKNGKHLLSLAARKASNGEDVWVPVGSRETHVRLRGDNTPQTGFIQTLLGKFRRRDTREKEITKRGIAGLRQRRRHVTLQNQPSGDVYGIEEYVKTARLLRGGSGGIQTANTIGPYSFAAQQRVGASISDFEPYDSKLILEEAEKMADGLAAQLKRQLGLAPQDELTIPAIKDKIDDLKNQGRARESGMMINDMHDLAVLDDIIESGDLSVVDNLKPGRRHALIETLPGVDKTDAAWLKKKKQRNSFDISQIVIPANAALSQAGRRRPKVRTFASGAPLLDEPSPDTSAAVPQRQATGPALIPGVGDVTGTIVFQNGKYFDTTTGRYLEDLSGLDSSSPDVIYQPVSMDEALTNGIDFLPEEWPVIQLDAGPGTPGRNLAAIAPGVNNPKLPPVGARRNSINKITSIPESFTEAFYLLRNRWRVLAAEDKNQTGRSWGRSVYSTSEMLDGQGSPLLSMADGLESEEGISTYFAPVNIPQSAGGDLIRALVASLRVQSKKTSNPLFAPYLDNSLLSPEELTVAGGSSVRSGFMTGTRSWREMVDAIGIRMALPFDTLYLPSGGNDRTHNQVPGQWDMFDDSDPKVMAVRHLNEAMQLDYSAKRMSDAINSGQQSNWDSMYGRTAGGLYDATPARLAELELQRDLAWQRATTSLVAAINNAQEERNQSLRDYREGRSGALVDDSPVDLYEITKFVNHGVIAEQLQSLLTKHVLTNPRIMDTLGNSSVRKMEQEARQANERMERLEILRAQSAALGLKNKATYTPDDIDPITLLPLLDPHGDGQTQNAPDRPLTDILQTLDEHAANGFSVEPLIDPVTGVSAPNTIADEQIEALALMDYAYQLAANQADPNDWGYQGLPEADTKYGHLDLDSLPAEQTAGYNERFPEFWALLEASGFNGHPLLLSSGEFRELATIEDANGNRQAIPIARGTKSTIRGRSANMLARLKRALLGNGGVMHGPGEYWSGKPTSWDSLNRDETTIGLLLRGRHRIGSSEILIATDDDVRIRPQARNGILAKHTYDALFTIANILDARGFKDGVNWSHGDQYKDEFPGLSTKNGFPFVRFDDRTGLYDAADLDLLQQAIDTLMTPGDVSLRVAGISQAGKMTVEYYSEKNNFFIDSIIPDFQGVTDARAASAVEERQRLNAFLGQNLSWIVQMAQMRRDESDPTNGPSNKQWNRRLDGSIHELVMMHPNTRVAMAGYDALIRHDQNNIDKGITTGYPYSRFGEFDMWESDSSIVEIRPSIVMVMNRSKTPMIRQPILDSGIPGRLTSKPLASSPTVWYKQIGLEISDLVSLRLYLNPPANPTPEEQDKLERIETILADWGVYV